MTSEIKETLEDIILYGGDTQTLLFQVFDKQNRPDDISTMTMNFSLIDYANKLGSAIFTKSGMHVPDQKGGISSTFKIVLSTQDTLNLFGKFIYQVSIADYQKQIKTYQGIMLINTNIDKPGILKQTLK